MIQEEQKKNPDHTSQDSAFQDEASSESSQEDQKDYFEIFGGAEATLDLDDIGDWSAEEEKKEKKSSQPTDDQRLDDRPSIDQLNDLLDKIKQH
jgi:hypothetical protein